MERFEVRDSGERTEYESGMIRDTQEGKPDYTLVPLFMLERWAMHMTRGAKKYGRENWTLANSAEEWVRFRSSAFRHFIQWLRGDVDEDHASAVFFNIAASEYVKERMNDAVEIVYSATSSGRDSAGGCGEESCCGSCKG